MAAQYGYLLANAPLLKTVAAMVPQHICMQGRQRRYASMASLLPGSCAEIDRVARCQPGTPTGAWLAMNCSCSAAPTRSHSAVATSVRNLSTG